MKAYVFEFCFRIFGTKLFFRIMDRAIVNIIPINFVALDFQDVSAY